MQVQASDAAALRRSSLAAAVDPKPTASTTPMSAARSNDARNAHNGARSSPPRREHAYTEQARPQGGHFADDSTASRPSLADWGHPLSAPVQRSARWAEVANAHRPTSVPLPSHSLDRTLPPAYRQTHHLQHQQQHQSPSNLNAPQQYLSMSHLQPQWGKAPPTHYAPYRMPTAPEPARHVLPNSDGEAPRMSAYSTHPPDPYSSHPSQAVPSYSMAPSSQQGTSSQGESVYPTPLSLTLPPLTSSFPSEPFALTSAYPPASNGEHSHYAAANGGGYGVAQQDGIHLGGERIPTLGEVYAKTRPTAPLMSSMPRANNADNQNYADGMTNGIPAGSAQPNSRKRKEPKDAASRKYHCSECEQKFARPSALATHILTHTREKPFVCTTCNRGFAVMSNLRRHCRVRSHALAPNQESTVKRDRTDVAADSGSRRKGSLDRDKSTEEHASPDESLSHSLPPPNLAENSSSSFTLPAPHLYPP
ncbi:hypothetical protein JCM8115_005083 [Rhodotorula mucilaginosa]|uniref:C2H2-type domain-containing protein n=1 Tax=Rhodotorula mucilaginosa TaxID=5537 RepID=A0A9P7B9H7_RHOMI|nr:hypothetical protein C6P46_000148 [Rhodotorula mucilaginosa]TKA58457.1 hypothetical protein B0A53_00196 [Rhodotorula sp. CCFEE 5036]